MVNFDDITSLLLGLNNDEKEEVIDNINEYIKSSEEEKEEYFSKLLCNAQKYRDYFQLVKLSKKIDSFFNNKISYDEVKDEVLNLRNIQYSFTDNLIKDAYDTFENKLYDFVLLGMFVDNFDIDKNRKVKDIFDNKLNSKINDIKQSIIPLPLLIKEIDRVEHSNKDRYKYIDKKLLDKLFYYENNKDKFKNESKNAESYNKKVYYEEQCKKIKIDLDEAKKNYKSSRTDEIINRVKVCLYVGALAASIVVPGIFAFKYKSRLKDAKSLQHYDTQTIYEDNRVKVGEYDEYSNDYKELQTYLKEYTKISDDLYKVKTYDLSNIDVDSLFDVVLDESNLTNIEFLRNNGDMFESVDTFKTIYKMKYRTTETTDIEKALQRKLTISVILIFIFSIINMFNIITQGDFIDYFFGEIFDIEYGISSSYNYYKDNYKKLKEQYEEIKNKLGELNNNKDIALFNDKLNEFENIIDEELEKLKKQKKIQM